MTGEQNIFSYADAAAAADSDAGALKRLQRRDLLSSPTERGSRPASDDVRQTKQAIAIDVDRRGAVTAEPGAHAVYDPAPLLKGLGLL